MERGHPARNVPDKSARRWDHERKRPGAQTAKVGDKAKHRKFITSVRPQASRVCSPTTYFITFPKKALTGTAQVTLEVLSLPPHPSLPGTDRTD
ncbi:MAG TPA: hypothetical protein VHV83_05085, partial [Armatimonadota bacterium]|nr:hypothetical protein [Armatimonadota bacterium]